MNLTKGNMTLGRKYKDDATGFTGTLTGYGTFLDGDQGLLQPPVDDKNVIPQAVWFDVRRLSFVD